MDALTRIPSMLVLLLSGPFLAPVRGLRLAWDVLRFDPDRARGLTRALATIAMGFAQAAFYFVCATILAINPLTLNRSLVMVLGGLVVISACVSAVAFVPAIFLAAWRRTRIWINDRSLFFPGAPSGGTGNGALLPAGNLIVVVFLGLIGLLIKASLPSVVTALVPALVAALVAVAAFSVLAKRPPGPEGGTAGPRPARPDAGPFSPSRVPAPRTPPSLIGHAPIPRD